MNSTLAAVVVAIVIVLAVILFSDLIERWHIARITRRRLLRDKGRPR
jgi:hypothetical protein